MHHQPLIIISTINIITNQVADQRFLNQFVIVKLARGLWKLSAFAYSQIDPEQMLELSGGANMLYIKQRIWNVSMHTFPTSVEPVFASEFS